VRPYRSGITSDAVKSFQDFTIHGFCSNGLHEVYKKILPTTSMAPQIDIAMELPSRRPLTLAVSY